MKMKKSYLLGGLVVAVAVSYAAGLMAHGVEVPAGSKKMEYFKNASRMKIKSMNVEGTNAFLEDIVASSDPKAPIACGLFRMDKGKSLTYTYGYDEAKIIIKGEMTINDGTTTVKALPGDVFFFPKGSTINFKSESSGLGFICGQREIDGA
jgi:ethanolamine utilization protein EutQ (cupin superfamily)